MVAEEMLSEVGDIAAARSERWHVEPYDVESIEQILAKPPLADSPAQVLVRRRHQTEVRPQRLLPAQPLEGALLQGPKQLHLKRRRQVADLVEEQGTAVRLLQPSDSRLDRASERAALVPEQLALEQPIRNRTAVDYDERAIGAGAMTMDGPGHELLPGARLAPSRAL